jgi:broad specificity phosphatase PhoE
VAWKLRLALAMKTVLFMRHAESRYNVLQLCNDDPSIPVPLTEKGRAQADAAAESLRHVPIDLIFVSQLLRAQETGERVNRYHGAPLRVDARLNDRRTGFEGRPVAEYLAARQYDPLGFSAEGGETYAELKARVLDILHEIRQLAVRRLLVVAHHEVLQVVHGHFNGLADQEVLNFWVENAGVLEYKWELQ